MYQKQTEDGRKRVLQETKSAYLVIPFLAIVVPNCPPYAVTVEI